MIKILLASRSENNESEAKEMYSCLADEDPNHPIGGIVQCYFPTKASHDRNAELFKAALEKQQNCINSQGGQHSWAHPGTSKHPTHCVECGLKYPNT